MNSSFSSAMSVLVDEQQAELGMAADALGHEHARRPGGPASGVDRQPRLLVGDEHLELAVAAHP